jgi:hypothetical protein
MTGRRRIGCLAAALSLMVMAGCDATQLAPRKTSVTPEARPSSLTPPRAAPAPVAAPSQASRDLASYYARVQQDLLVRGLLRTDGGGPDTPFTDTMLVRNFEQIALRDEFESGQGLRRSSGQAGAIKKWVTPVRVTAEFGPRAPKEQQSRDRQALSNYIARLARVTGHPISMSGRGANFYVLFVSEDDKGFLVKRVRSIVPEISDTAIGILETLPTTVHCLVFAFSAGTGDYAYDTAIAIIRTEHPDLLRLSCIHEEVAQGLGLGNDDPRARPSIFNDDDEFALLTSHDELLLKILYDPLLTPGMRADEAMPIVRNRATELMGQGGPT